MNRLTDIKSISSKFGRCFRSKSEIKDYVESPLVDSCRIFYDKNIRTIGSSANCSDAQETHKAWIAIDSSHLSSSNEKVVDQLILDNWSVITDIEPHYVGIIKIIKNVDENTSCLDLQEYFISIAQMFIKQNITWSPAYTDQELSEVLIRCFGDLVPDIITMMKKEYYFDLETNKYYLSRELFEKSKRRR